MKKICLNDGWKFQYDFEGNFFNFNPSMECGTDVTLPHDFIIGKDRNPIVPGQYRTGYYPGAAGIYSRYLDVTEKDKNQKYILEIDGSFMNTIVMVNSDIVLKHPYGYTAFHADLTKYIKCGKRNKISVYVNNCFLPNSRWYTGGGLYRDVKLLVSKKIYIKPWSIGVKTNEISDQRAVVSVETEIVNETGNDFEGECLIKVEYDSQLIVEKIVPLKIKSNNSDKIVGIIQIDNPKLWDIDSPNLYQADVIIKDKSNLVDIDKTNFGIRIVTADAVNGLLLNFKPIKLKGGCVHHDCGILGAAAWKDYEYRKVKIHKDNGFNAIRCAHNPPSSHFLDACDRYGILVIDEAFDSWRMGKTLNDYSLFFEEWWERDLTSMILRDRNHPSVIMWSIGNEIGERSGDSDGYEWAERISEYARKLDATRLITSGICAIWPTEDQEKKFAIVKKEEMERVIEGKCPQKQSQEMHKKIHEVNLDTPFSRRYWAEYTENYAKVLDVVGYNYMENRYESDGMHYSERVICGTESFAQNIDQIWALVEKYPHVIGDFAWTSYDYIGEAGIGKAIYFDQGQQIPEYEIAHDSEYPWRLANTSDFDICGFPTAQAAYRRIVWGSPETYIAVHNPQNYGKKEILSLWGWPDCTNHFTYPGFEGKEMEVTVYSNGTEVELFHNRHSLGRKKTNRFKATYQFTYMPGELKAISYKEKNIQSDMMIETAESPHRLNITIEKQDLKVERQRLIFAVVEIVDKDGNLVPISGKKVKAEVQGKITLKAFGNAHPRSEENYTTGEFSSYKGKILAIIDLGNEFVRQNGDEKSKSILRVTAEGIMPASVELE